MKKIMNSSAKRLRFALLLGSCLTATAGWGQVQPNATVPRVMNYTGLAKDSEGRAFSGIVGATFAIYADQQGGSPLWMETQNIIVGVSGGFSVTLGASTPAGLPPDLFSSGQARWLGITFNGGSEKPRVSLVSVPYALQAGDAQTLGGLPPSAFVLATASMANMTLAAPVSSSDAKPPTFAVGQTGLAPTTSDVTTTGGTVGAIAAFSSATNIQNSILSQVGTTSINVGGKLNLPATGTATSAAGKNSRPADFVASVFNSSSAAAVAETFQLQAEAAGNNTASPSGTLNFLFGSGTSNPTETGLKISNKGIFSFATGQTFPGTGTITGVTTATGSGLSGGGASGSLSLSLLKTCTTNQTLQWNGTSWACASTGSGTITGVTAGTALTGGGTSGNVTLNIDTTKVPQLNLANTFNANQTITANGGSAALNVTQTATSGVTSAITATSRVPTDGDAAILGQELSNAEVFGVQGYISNSTGTGAGVFGSNAGPGATGSTYKGAGAGVWGDAGTFGTTGVLATADKGNGLVAYNNSSIVSTIVGENLNTTASSTALAPGVFGISSAPFGLGMIGSGPVHSNTFNNNVGFNPVGVVGDSSAAAGIGVWGVTDSGTSVYGSTNSGTGLYGLSGAGTGVLGVSSTGIGVSGGSTVSAGVAGASPASGNSGVYGLTTNTDLSNASYGVWGDDSVPTGSAGGSNGGVYGYSQGGDGVVGVSAATSGIFNSAGIFLSTVNALPLTASGARGNCSIDFLGDLVCTGSKSAAVLLTDNRWVRLYAVESPENWFEDFGSSTLANGSASITLEPTFRDTVTSSRDYHVFLTPRGECEGLYLASTSASGFEVRELHHGTSNISFDYRIVVRRKGYENIRMEDVTEMQDHLAAQREMLQRPRHRPAIVQPVAGRNQAEVQLSVPLRSNPLSHPNQPPLAFPVQPAAATKR